MRLLLVEDDPELGRATAEALRVGFALDWVTSAEAAEEALRVVGYDLLVLDVVLPGRSGIDLLRQLRRDAKALPVLLLTARDSTRHKVEGLNAGADDYLVKPFDIEELLARCAALLRRSAGHAEPVIAIGPLRFEPATGQLERDGRSIALSGRERAILATLAASIGRPVSKARIEECVYDWTNNDVDSNVIEVHVANLRRKIGRDAIRTIRGVGYQIDR